MYNQIPTDLFPRISLLPNESPICLFKDGDIKCEKLFDSFSTPDHLRKHSRLGQYKLKRLCRKVCRLDRAKTEGSVIPVRDLFESHLTVTDLQRSMSFFGEIPGLELAQVVWERRAAFYWIGGRGNSMLGLWEVGTGPQKLSLHVAFRADLEHLLDAPARLRAGNVVPLDFWGQPTDEPVVLGWMPAASIYFRDPDGNMIEFLSMLPDSPQPELGIVGWSRWTQIRESARAH